LQAAVAVVCGKSQGTARDVGGLNAPLFECRGVGGSWRECQVTSRLHAVLALAFCVALAGCASVDKSSEQRQVASVLKFLFPGAQQPPPPSDTVAVVQVPFRIGVAFVPDEADPAFRLSETDRLKLATQVRDAFARYPFIREIEAVPSLYLEPGGGFANLDRIAALLRLDVIALVSYDQVQHAGASGWSFLYWTGCLLYTSDAADDM
jgi:rhombotail lipoprotein